jgi:hypothetical protein
MFDAVQVVGVGISPGFRSFTQAVAWVKAEGSGQ